MYECVAGTDIKAGAMVYLGKDGKAYPLVLKRSTLRSRLIAALRRVLRRPARRRPIGIALADRSEGEALPVQVHGRIL